MTKRAVIYARVSTEEQGKGYSLPTQIEGMHKHAVEQGYEVVNVFQDMHTGTELDRPGLNKVYEFLEKEGFDILLVHDVDRLSREVGNQAIIEMELARYNVEIEYVLGGYTKTAEGELMKLIKAGIAQYENRQRVERSRRGKLGKVKAGYIVCPAGRAPFGYTFVQEERKSWFEINEKEAEVVRKIYYWLVEEGISSYLIAKRLWEQHILTKGDYTRIVIKKTGYAEWSPSTVRKIISNTVYKGVWYYNKTHLKKTNGKRSQIPQPESEWIKVNVPAIIDEKTWERAQVCLAKNRENAKRNTQRTYLLRSLVFCPCGRRWTSVYKSHLKRAYYRCPSNDAEKWRHKCPNRFSIRQEILETKVWEFIAQMFMDPEALHEGLSKQRSEAQKILERKKLRIEAIHNAIDDVDRKLGMLLDQVLAGSFAQSVLDQKRKDLMAQRSQLEGEGVRAQRDLEMITVTPEQELELVEFARQISEKVDNATDETKRRIFDILQLRVDVIDPTHVKVSGVLCDPDGQIVDLSCWWRR